MLKAKIRIKGDLVDHLEIVNKKNQPKASLDIKLDNGQIKNIISFKLFIPKTKRDKNFLIFQGLM